MKKVHEPVNVESSTMEMEVEMEDDVIPFLDELEEKGLGDAYLIQNVNRQEVIYLTGLIQIGNSYYFDFYKLDFGLDVFAFPVHIFMKTTIDENELKMHMFSEEWLKNLIGSRQIRIKHEVNDMDSFIMTASTAELQKFVAKYGDMEEAYRHSETYKKTNNEPEFVFETEEDE